MMITDQLACKLDRKVYNIIEEKFRYADIHNDDIYDAANEIMYEILTELGVDIDYKSRAQAVKNVQEIQRSQR